MLYVVIVEIPSTGYISCAGIYKNMEQAYGKAYLEVTEGCESDEYYVTVYERTEGDDGYIIECYPKGENKEPRTTAIVLFVDKERYAT